MVKLDETEKLSLYMSYLAMYHVIRRSENNEEVNDQFLWEAYYRLKTVLTGVNFSHE